VDYEAAGRLMKNLFTNYDEKLLAKYESLRAENAAKFSLEAMDKVFHPLLDKYVPKFAMEEAIRLPKLKRISLPGTISSPRTPINVGSSSVVMPAGGCSPADLSKPGTQVETSLTKGSMAEPSKDSR
jgi:hypothetical protein